MNSLRVLLAVTIAALPGAGGVPPAASRGTEEAGSKPPPFERLPNGDLRLGQITLRRRERALAFPAVLALRQGALEVLIATSNGRVYESLLSTTAQPLHLQTLLYLLGLENGPRLPDAKGRRGDCVNLDIEWVGPDGRRRRTPVENWVRDNRTGKRMRRQGWVFVGSSFLKGQCVADLEGNIALLYSSGETILETMDPRSADDTLFSAEPDFIPLEPGQRVTVVATPRPPPADAARTLPGPRSRDR
ncbi:MAG: hypothetical protein GXP31_04300 [Kiritimatiellaeota bacterium]|nr:hypothetical protein [Kiritimatiellota bacterium]